MSPPGDGCDGPGVSTGVDFWTGTAVGAAGVGLGVTVGRSIGRGVGLGCGFGVGLGCGLGRGGGSGGGRGFACGLGVGLPLRIGCCCGEGLVTAVRHTALWVTCHKGSHIGVIGLRAKQPLRLAAAIGRAHNQGRGLETVYVTACAWTAGLDSSE